ncbi:hypothetical protein OH687_30650 [Burkholderia anthina]|nr:hypothetical protein OH687_30650 [Burkholderia anthina]
MAPGAVRYGNVHASGDYYDLFSGGILCNFFTNEKRSCSHLSGNC